MSPFLKNQTVLITGGTGSFGTNFTRYLLRNTKLKKLIIFSRDELKQFELQNSIRDKRLRFFIGDVRDLERVKTALSTVDIVVHAAALKQVPALEYNPTEAIKTNTLGSQNIIDAAIEKRVKKVLLISTDKAAEPCNLYGATKLCAEKLFISGNLTSAYKTLFSVVRYGNVLGSRGSIVESLIKNDFREPINITDPDMTRFWITYDQSFQLVRFALGNMRGGEIFIPKLPAMRLDTLINALAPGRPKKITGPRPGEKIHEVLLTQEEGRHAVELAKYFVILPNYPHYPASLFNKYRRHGKKLTNGFSYSSNNNQQKLTVAELKKLTAKLFQ